MQPRISMITLGVAKLERAVAFYQQGLGFPRIESPPSVAFFSLSGSWLGLYPREALAVEAQVPAAGSGFDGIALAHNVTSKAQVDVVLAQAATAGAVITREAGTMHWGGYSGYFKDPDNYLWEVAYNPFVWIGPEAMPDQ